jgi:hypothetical protein
LIKLFLGAEPERDSCLAIVEHTNAKQDLVTENGRPRGHPSAIKALNNGEAFLVNKNSGYAGLIRARKSQI